MSLPHFDPDAERQSNWEYLANRSIDTGGQSIGIRGDVATLTWPGGTAVSATLTVAHGLPNAPASVDATARDVNTNVAVLTGITDTDFPLRGCTLDGSQPANGTTVQVFWIAIG